ncbi:MAG TPA: penicillin-binding transpeptidase domain-containing protein [Pirellulales bacterium]|jgi:penicillin-binding protein 2|nr:penicillin-binding transpeptidase domain-containing protein [Pirellulales bacterium]
MARPDQHFEWHELVAQQAARPGVAGTRSRLRWLISLVALAAAIVFARAVQLDWTDGAAFRAEAARPIERAKLVPASRGRILARDGSLLATDTRVLALAVHYRWFEEPVNPAWLARQARARLSRGERRDKTRLAAAEAAVLAERAALQGRLARLCGLPLDDWQARGARVQQRVVALAEHVNQRRMERFLALGTDPVEQPDAPATWLGQVGAALAEMLAPEAASAPAPVVLAEQEDFHPLLEDIPPEVAAEIAAHEADYPGTKVIEPVQRDYPAGTLAAHVVGQLGPATTEESTDAESGLRDPALRVGRTGIECNAEATLRGRPGLDVQRVDHRGHAMSLEHRRTPQAGEDVVLAIDPTLQRAAESLLDDACRPAGSAGAAEGGAAAVMDVETGELWVSASAPRFDPRVLATGDSARVGPLLAASNHPLFDRVAKMAIPPGSVFKTLTAVALLEEGVCRAEEPFFCQGFLETPDSLRCLLFRQQGIGHGDVTLADALARSCNVYFFHHAGALGIERLTAWGERFGFGQSAGIELPDEAAGSLPQALDEASEAQRLAMVRSLAIGQGTLRVTPLQIVRLTAALANGGRLLNPTLKKRGRDSFIAGRPIPALHQGTLDAVRQGMCATVADVEGTAYASARLASVAIAGKTGTAQTAGADHAWFAGFAPADSPRVAFVVVLEHGGAADRAARIARELVADMHRLGRLAQPPGLAGD